MKNKTSLGVAKNIKYTADDKVNTREDRSKNSINLRRYLTNTQLLLFMKNKSDIREKY